MAERSLARRCIGGEKGDAISELTNSSDSINYTAANQEIYGIFRQAQYREGQKKTVCACERALPDPVNRLGALTPRGRSAWPAKIAGTKDMLLSKPVTS